MRNDFRSGFNRLFFNIDRSIQTQGCNFLTNKPAQKFFCLFWNGMFKNGMIFAFFLLGSPMVVKLLPLGRPLFLIFCGILILVSSSLVVPKAVKTLIFYDSKYFSMHEYLIESF
jgi:hypothetical protein